MTVQNAGSKLANALRIGPRDNVAVALEDIPADSDVMLAGGRRLRALNAIPFAHKIAINEIACGTSILKYGVPIALATADIRLGEWVHEHNVESFLTAKREKRQ